MLLPTSGLALNSTAALADKSASITSDKDNSSLLAEQLKGKVPGEIRPLSSDEEQGVVSVLSKVVGAKVSSELQGKKLNTDYGLMGAEQHLYRYPGDSIYAHVESARDWAMYGGAGMAPGLGAWGYFAPSREQMSTEDIQREKYYIAVQTFLSPGFAERVAEYRDFYKYRKMLVVNPETGQAVVADIADAGPSPFTGKQLGGSPEVMQAVGLGSGPRKGAVLYFFIDDPSNAVPLGPVKIPDSIGGSRNE